MSAESNLCGLAIPDPLFLPKLPINWWKWGDVNTFSLQM